MNDNGSDYFDDSEWDDPVEPIWREFDWQRYLRESEGEIERFVKLYTITPPAPDRLDQVARGMGWDSGDWSIDDPQGFRDQEREVEEDDTAGDLGEYDPYTVHQHPVYLATRGLYLFLRRGWESLLGAGVAPADPTVSWLLSRSFHEGETAGLLATQAVELGDVELAVCHFKQMLVEINRSIAQLPDNRTTRSKLAKSVDSLMRATLFDLREIALRVIYECRDEARRRPTDRD